MPWRDPLIRDAYREGGGLLPLLANLATILLLFGALLMAAGVVYFAMGPQ